jgi:hypothetical protein
VNRHQRNRYHYPGHDGYPENSKKKKKKKKTNISGVDLYVCGVEIIALLVYLCIETF